MLMLIRLMIKLMMVDFVFLSQAFISRVKRSKGTASKTVISIKLLVIFSSINELPKFPSKMPNR